MTSDDIRKHKICEVEAPLTSKCTWLKEIAYQLAKLNEHLETVDAAVFGGMSEKKKEVPETGDRS